MKGWTCCSNQDFLKYFLTLTEEKEFCLEEKTTPICGGTLTEPRGRIYSPEFPNNYPTNVNCDWTIQLPKTSNIILSFLSMDIEEDEDCL